MNSRSPGLRPRGASILLATVAALLAPLTGAGGQETAPDTLRRHRIEGVTVTATRSSALRADLPQRIELVSALDVERTPADDVADLLKKNASVDVIQYPGLLSGIGIRGFRPEFSGINTHTLLLIDGRPAGTANLATLDRASIERVEVLKGPASSLYGASAMGGTVNVITRRSAGTPLRGRATGSYGSYTTTDLNAWAGGTILPRVDTDLSVAWFQRGSDYRIGEGNLLRGLVGGGATAKLLAGAETTVPEIGDGQRRENTEYGYRSGTARLGYRLAGNLRAEVRGETFDAQQVQTPGDLYAKSGGGAGRKNVGRSTAEASLGGTLGRFSPTLRAYSTEEETEYYDISPAEPFVSYVGGSRTSGVQLQSDARWGSQVLTAGVDVGSARAESRRYSAPDSRIGTFSPDAALHTAAAFAQGRISLGRLSGTVGGRVDRITLRLEETLLRPDVRPDRERFTTFNPSAGAQYALGGGVRAHATVGRAFVAPDAVHKAGRSQTGTASAAAITLGNADVGPERSVTWDGGVGLDRPAAGIEADITYFRTSVEDRITRARATFPATGRPRTPDGTAVASVSTYVNAAEASIEGVEWRVSYDLGAPAGFRRSLRVFANATHLLRAEELTPALTIPAAHFRGRTNFEPEEVLGALLVGDPVMARVRNVADLTLSHGLEYDDLRRFSARLTGRYVGERADFDFNDGSDVEYPPFMVVDLASSLSLGDAYRLGVQLHNLTDENYYEKRGYNLPGRELRLSVAAEF